VRPLDGILVLDLTRLLPGASATLVLAQFGAEVIKIEEPGRGDYMREMAPEAFAMLNCGKKSVALDLKTPAGARDLAALAARADVLVESFRPGVMDRLGMGYEALRETNPRLIYAAITGYGQSGPLATMAGHDINYIALGGLLGLTGTPDGPPVIPGVPVADLAGGALQAVVGILLALMARLASGRGQFVDISMLAGVEALLPQALGRYQATGRLPAPGGEVLTGGFACYNLYQAADGRWVAVGALEPKFWAALCQGLECESLIPDQYGGPARQAQLKADLAERFQTKSAREWFELFREADACITPVLFLSEIPSPGIVPRLLDTPGATGGEAPKLGEHTDEILGRQ